MTSRTITAIVRAVFALVIGACLGFVIGVCMLPLVPSQWLPEDQNGILTFATFGGPPLLAGGIGFASWVLAREWRGYSTERPIMIAGIALGAVVLGVFLYYFSALFGLI